MPRPLSRLPLSVRRVVLLLGASAAMVALPGVAQAGVNPAGPLPLAVRALAAPAHALVTGTPAHAARPARPGQPGGVCQVPGVGDIGGLLGFCNAGTSGVIGDLNNVCQPAVPAPESATGGIDSLIRPPASAISRSTLYDNYGMAGQSWAAYDLQCSDMTSLIGNNFAGVMFGFAKALDRVTITVYQSAAGEGILSWLTGSVDNLISSLGKAIYFPYLAPVIIIGAIWLAWQGLIRKRASRTIEGTVWMVIACAAAIWLIGRPADFTGVGRTVSDGITQTLNIAFAKLPAPQQTSCVPLQKGDPQTPAGGSFVYTSGNGVVDSNANELWTVLVCKPWLDGEFGTTNYAVNGGHPTVVNKYGRQLLWAQAIAANEKATTAVITAKQDAFAGIASSIKQNDPAAYPLFQGKQWTTRLEIAFAALFAALAAGLLVLLIAITLIILKLGFLLLLVAGPFFLIIGTHPGFGRVIALRWAEMLIGVLLKQAAIALVLSVLLYAYSLIMGASDAVLPWALKILMISLVTVAVFIYRKPFGHLFSAVGYGVIGSRDRADASLAKAASTAGRNTVDAATVGVPGFAAYRAARWARRNPAQAASLAAQVATGGAAAGVMAGAAAAGSGGQSATGGGPREAGPGEPGPADAPHQGAGTRSGTAGRGRARAEAGGNGAGRTPPPLELPPRQAENGPPPLSSWSRGGGGDPARPRWPGAAARSASDGAPPRPAPSSAPPRAGAAPAAPAPQAARSNGGRPARSSEPPKGWGNAGGRDAERVPARDAAAGGPPPGPSGPSGPFWLRPLRRRK
jgi:TrbL/VirB6 plasmid conjugal transfer protein